MSLLSIVQGAAVELGFAEPTAVFSSTDPTVVLLRQIASKEGIELARRFDWQNLTKEATFTTTAAEVQVLSIPTTFTDFGRIINKTMWDRTQALPVRGPFTASEWQARKGWRAQFTYGNYFRIRGNSLLFFTAPAAGNEIFFEYISNQWCSDSAGLIFRTDWALDTDVALVDEEVIRLGILWRYRKAKNFDYGEDFRTYEMALADIFGPDGGKADVDMTGSCEDNWGVYIPDGNWNI